MPGGGGGEINMGYLCTRFTGTRCETSKPSISVNLYSKLINDARIFHIGWNNRIFVTDCAL